MHPILVAPARRDVAVDVGRMRGVPVERMDTRCIKRRATAHDDGRATHAVGDARLARIDGNDAVGARTTSPRPVEYYRGDGCERRRTGYA